uniref:C2H2-type domain-containing protein n=1 Tax=viral metagenome TaxID=1070528 RepID=A0A6C0E5W2_9ZZZZ
MFTKKEQKTAEKYKCEICEFYCSKKSNYERHLSTRKHMDNDTDLQQTSKKEPKVFKCECGGEYKYRQSLYTHRKKCNAKQEQVIVDEPPSELQILKDLVLEVVKQNNELVKSNNELQKQVLEVCKNTNTTTTTTNSHNKTFNLNFFLNEQCKDAMNMSEFINQIQLKLSDLENVGKVGYVEGISNIIIKKLNDTDIYKRPLHCSDAKRETLYIKDEDKWEKESPENTNMKNMVKKVDYKNIGLIAEWKDQHPDHRESTCHDNDTYLKILVESMSGDDGHVEKVIKKISKEVVIDK